MIRINAKVMVALLVIWIMSKCERCDFFNILMHSLGVS